MLSNKTLIILTTILSVLILVTVFFNSCLPAFADEKQKKNEDAMYGIYHLNGLNTYRKISIDGHEYLMFHNDRHGSICVIHSESCPCKNKKK